MKEKITSKIIKLLKEFFIVFLGVFLAFQLNNYKEEITADKLRNNYYKLLLNDFSAILRELTNTKNEIDKYLTEFKNENEKGNMPLIKPYKYNIENNLLVIRSVYEKGALENLSDKFVTNLSFGSNHLTRVSKLMDRYANLVDAALQNNDWKYERFYGSDKKLKDEYSWYITELEYILFYLKQLEAAIQEGAIPDIKILIAAE